MKALVYTGTEKLEYKDFNDPSLINGESIIKVSASGICGSDMHAYRGKDERRIPPLILGHEVSGIIEQGSKKGKKVVKEIKGQLGKKKETAREKMIGQSIGYRYDVNLLPDYSKLTPFLKKYIEAMGWDDLNWLEDVHMGYEEDRPAVFCRNANGWVTIPKSIKLPNNQQDRDMIARELLVKFQMSPKHPLVDLKKAYLKF